MTLYEILVPISNSRQTSHHSAAISRFGQSGDTPPRSYRNVAARQAALFFNNDVPYATMCYSAPKR
jgi:hypothetical protein